MNDPVHKDFHYLSIHASSKRNIRNLSRLCLFNIFCGDLKYQLTPFLTIYQIFLDKNKDKDKDEENTT